MYRPREFDAPDLARAAEHVRLFPFGVLVSGGHGGDGGDGGDGGAGSLRATHLPFLLGPAAGDEPFPPTLLSHGSALNAQLQQLADGDEVLVVLPGPDAYVSAGWYRHEDDVPTWDYTAVHVSGRYRRLDRAGTDRLLADTVTTFEDDRGEPGWDLARLDEPLVRGLARGVIAFEVHVGEVRSAAKLSQDKVPGDVGRVRAGIRRRDGAHPVLDEMDRHHVTGRAPTTAPTTAPATAPTTAPPAHGGDA